MIRKNDASLRKGTITEKLNWHISSKSVYGRSRRGLQRGCWPRTIGLHYTDGTNKYEKRLVGEYEVLKEINRVTKKQRNISGTLWTDKITYYSYKDFKSIVNMAQNIAKKYGFELIREKNEAHFPWVRITRVRNHYVYPYYNY